MKPQHRGHMGPEYPFATQREGTPVLPFDPASLLVQQRRSGEAMASAGRSFLEGMQQVASRSFQVQSALFRQFFVGTLALLQAGSGAQADQAIRDLGAASEATAKAIRDMVEAACKCSFDTTAAFSRGIGGVSAGAAAIDVGPRQG